MTRLRSSTLAIACRGLFHLSPQTTKLLREHLAVLEGLDRAGWERTGRHVEHGEMSLELYETHVAGEEVDHLAQIARLL